MTTHMLTTGRLLAAAAITVAALGLSFAVPPGNSDDVASAATLNWLRPCSTVKSHPLHTACTVTLAVQPHQLTVYDTAGKKHVLNTGTKVWHFAEQRSVKCRTLNAKSCYGHDELTGAKVIALGSRIHYTLAYFHH